MNDIQEFFARILDSNNWPARWHCGRWTPFHGWLYIVSNLVIALAYFSIPMILLYLIRKTGKQLPFQKIFWLFLLFILACGITHVFDALMFWYPFYRVSALMLALTAVISSAAVVGLFRIVPAALSLKSPAYLETIIHQRTAELETANEILTQKNNELKEARNHLELLLKQKDEFINIVSHELKTPVTSLKMYTQLLTRGGTSTMMDADAMFKKMDGQIHKLTKLINDLLDTTRLDQGRLDYQFETFRLDTTLKEVIEQVQLTCTHQLLVKQLEAVNVHADKLRIEQVVSNFLTNAVKFSPGQGQVEISLITRDGMAICGIKDFGMGIPAQEQEKIFTKYHRVDRDKSYTFPGLGLGLFIVKNIVEKHNGKVWLESEVDRGSTFYFSIPLVK